MKKLFPLLAIMLVTFAACKDDDTTTTPDPELTTAQKIQQKWNIDNIIDINYEGMTTTVESRDTFPPTTGDYIHFLTNNTAEFRFDGETDNVGYKIVNDQTLEFDGDVFSIVSLTEKTFVFKFEDRSGDPYYDNYVYLSR